MTKLLFAAGVVATAAVFLPQIARPGADGRNFLVIVSLPFIVIAALASMALGSAHWSAWADLVVGNTWLAWPFHDPTPCDRSLLGSRLGAAYRSADCIDTGRRCRRPCCRRVRRHGLLAPVLGSLVPGHSSLVWAHDWNLRNLGGEARARPAAVVSCLHAQRGLALPSYIKVIGFGPRIYPVSSCSMPKPAPSISSLIARFK